MQLDGIRTHADVILGESRIARYVIGRQVVVGRTERIPAAAGARGVALVPDAELDIVVVQLVVGSGTQTKAVDAIFRGASFVAKATELIDDIGQCASGVDIAPHNQLREINGEQ